jgi:hypothetical protein
MPRAVIVATVGVLLTGVGVLYSAAADGIEPAAVQTSSAASASSAPAGIAYGLDMLSMSNELCAGGQIGVPLTGGIAIILRPMILGSGSPSSVDVGGRIEVRFQTAMHDRFRAYFGAGPQGFYELRGAEAHHHDVSGGWDAGLEFFIDDHLAFHWEIGTSGGGVFGGAGPVFAVGINAYPHRVSQRASNE